ncbi:MAG: hypothetical protein LBS60_08395 [Deltaproteobacteria bacterium]|nr:hypothetical protein [Deltaproteobacteria bacterium]
MKDLIYQSFSGVNFQGFIREFFQGSVKGVRGIREISMADIITFYSPKGCQGKTILSINYALYSNSCFFTNDCNKHQVLIEKLLPKGDFNYIHHNDNSVELPDNRDSVIDFNYFSDERIFPLAKVSKACVIPLYYQSNWDLDAFYYAVEQISYYNNNIIVVLNNMEHSISHKIYEDLKSKLPYPIRIVKKSIYLHYIYNDGLTPFQIQGVPGTVNKPLDQLRDQLKELFNLIDFYKNSDTNAIIDLKNTIKTPPFSLDSDSATSNEKPEISPAPSDALTSTGQLSQNRDDQVSPLKPLTPTAIVKANANATATDNDTTTATDNTTTTDNDNATDKVTQKSIYFSKDMKDDLIHILCNESLKYDKIIKRSSIIRILINQGFNNLDKIDIPSYFNALFLEEKERSFSAQVCVKLATEDVHKYKDIFFKKIFRDTYISSFATFLRHLYLIGLEIYKKDNDSISSSV